MEYNGVEYRGTKEFIDTAIKNGEDMEYVLGRLYEIGIKRIVAMDMYEHSINTKER